MRIGRLTKAGTGPALSLESARAYLNEDPADLPDASLSVYVAEATERAERWTSLALGASRYELPYSGAQGGEHVLLPDWPNIAAPTSPAGATLDFALPVVTLPDDAPADGTVAFTAGYGPALLPADIRTAVRHLMNMAYEDLTGPVPALVERILNSADRGLVNAGRPVILRSFDSTTGRYTT